MKPWSLWILLISALQFSNLYTQQAEPYENGPVHEAYITASTEGGVILQSIALQPPEPINEQQPPKCHNDAIWIPGYWAWEKKIDNFVWVSGVWRRSPPDHLWVPGYWNKFGVGWAWVRGFWSKVPQANIQYIQKRPPEQKIESIPPSPGKNYFWMSGYWNYNYTNSQYNWLTGRWAQLDANWVYVPAYYLWRPEGYIFIPGYWDLPLELRGCIYSPVTIQPDVRETIIYTPSVILTTESIIHWCFLYYPNYNIFFWHYRFFYPAFWDAWCCIPPWWAWDTCWCFSWADNWWLWWWWTHPGFAHPPWITINIAINIIPPPVILLQWLQGVFPPVIIAPWGVVNPWDLIDALAGNLPVMPWEPEEIANIFDQLKPKTPQKEPLKPKGDGSTGPLPRPPVGEEAPDEETVTPPEKPQHLPPPSEPPPTYYPPPQAEYPPIAPPTYVPVPTPPVYVPQPRPPVYYPPHYPRPRPPVSKPPHYPRPRPPVSKPPHYPKPKPPVLKPPHYPRPRPPGYQPPRGPRKPNRYPPGQIQPSHPPTTYPPQQGGRHRGTKIHTPRRGGGKSGPYVYPQGRGGWDRGTTIHTPRSGRGKSGQYVNPQGRGGWNRGKNNSSPQRGKNQRKGNQFY